MSSETDSDNVVEGELINRTQPTEHSSLENNVQNAVIVASTEIINNSEIYLQCQCFFV